MRMRSPSTAPPLIGLDGSTATTATAWPCGEPGAEQRVDERRLAAAGRAGDADDPGAAGALARARRGGVVRAGASSSISVSRRASARRSPAIARSARRARPRRAAARSARPLGRRRRADRRSPRQAVAPRSDDDERLAEAEIAAQAAADLLVRQAGARAVDDRAEDVAVACSSAARVRSSSALRDRGARARRLGGAELVEVALHRRRDRAARPAAGCALRRRRPGTC